jgi:hypothetical protein
MFGIIGGRGVIAFFGEWSRVGETEIIMELV